MDKDFDSAQGEVSRTPEPGVYVAPRIQTYSPEEFLDLLGPAQGYGGGSNGPDQRSSGRGQRKFPGLR